MNIKINAKRNQSKTIKNVFDAIYMLTDEFPAPSIFSLAYLFLLIVVVTLTFTFNLVAVIYLPRICQDHKIWRKPPASFNFMIFSIKYTLKFAFTLIYLTQHVKNNNF